MILPRERRKAPRVSLAKCITVRARASLIFEVRLIDLSLRGARIAHVGLLRPGSPSVLEFPPPLGPLTLCAEVARSCVVGTQLNQAGERQLRYESGLAFVNVTADQQAMLAGILDQLTPASVPGRSGSDEVIGARVGGAPEHQTTVGLSLVL